MTAWRHWLLMGLEIPTILGAIRRGSRPFEQRLSPFPFFNGLEEEVVV
ncbi:MAG: hypothetical protein JWR01_2920 [Subtercola sp.]|nr:hypothetical protein [Subtercola sp.]